MKKLLITIYIIIFATLAYYVVNLFIDRDFKNDETTTESPTQTDISSDTTNIPTTDTSITENEDLDNSQESDTVTTKTAKYDITRTDCDNNCATIANEDKKEYCLQVCGLSPHTETNSDSCEDLTGLNKDYCLRDKAIAEDDIDKCAEIQDGGIEKQCKNRINEDFIDNIMK